MTTETWDPKKASQNTSAYSINISWLKKIITDLKDNDDIDISDYLSKDEQQEHKEIMQQPKEKWFSLKEALAAEEIILLIKFFTLAEMQYSGWQAEEKSPVIWLTKLLRQQGNSLDKPLLVWIKTNSNNKFLPNGPL